MKKKWLRGEKGGEAGKWNARKAMLAVAEYKARGGGYVGPRDRENSLKKWEKEDWGYIDGDQGGRYLPAAVRAALTPAERRRENEKKRGKKGEWVPYSGSVVAKMRRAGIFGDRPRRSSAAKRPRSGEPAGRAARKPAAKKPAAGGPAEKKPAAKKSAAGGPAAKKPAVKKAAAKKAAAEKPAMKKAAAEKPAMKKPAARKKSS